MVKHAHDSGKRLVAPCVLEHPCLHRIYLVIWMSVAYYIHLDGLKCS